MAERTTPVALYAALLGNLAIAVTKFTAFAFTGGSAMFSEGVHSLVDTGNEILLIYGERRSRRPPDDTHPLGYGRELFFWSFVVAILIFALGAGVAIYEGVTHILEPEPITRPTVTFVVFGLSAIFEAISLGFAWRSFRRTMGSDRIWTAFRRSKDPATFTVLFEDTAALTGVAVAAIGSAVALLTGNAVWDGVASIVIGAVLGFVAVVLARESKQLLLGEAADPDLVRTLRETVEARPEVRRVTDIVTVQLGVDQVFAALSVEFPDAMTIPTLERLIATIARQVRERHPEVTRVFVRPEPSDHPHVDRSA